MNYFVYVGSSRHLWRFVYFAKNAEDGDDAIRQAWSEAIDMGELPTGSYMAVAAEHITTRQADPMATKR